jgi:hypothetical protein
LAQGKKEERKDQPLFWSHHQLGKRTANVWWAGSP